MKTNNLQKMLAVVAVAGLALSVSAVLAQDSPAAKTTQPAAINAPAPQLSSEVREILKLAQAKVNDDTIIAYIKNSGNSYGLNADQIIYLRQQGISSAVITAMLNQPKAMVAAVPPVPPTQQPVASPANNGQVATVPAPPTVTYVQPAPETTYYYQPYYQPYYYPYYYYYPTYWYPPVSFPFGWGGGWHGGWHDGGFGGGWHGGGHGDWHGGGHR